MRITTSVLQKLLAALNECTEWGQVFILDSLAHYTPKDGCVPGGDLRVFKKLAVPARGTGGQGFSESSLLGATPVVNSLDACQA